MAQQLNMNIDNGGQPITVSEMRRRLASILSGLRGDQMVTFSFTARLPHYTPSETRRTLLPGPGLIEGIHVVYGELARPENE